MAPLRRKGVGASPLRQTLTAETMSETAVHIRERSRAGALGYTAVEIPQLGAQHGQLEQQNASKQATARRRCAA